MRAKLLPLMVAAILTGASGTTAIADDGANSKTPGAGSCAFQKEYVEMVLMPARFILTRRSCHNSRGTRA